MEVPSSQFTGFHHVRVELFSMWAYVVLERYIDNLIQATAGNNYPSVVYKQALS